MKEPKVSFSDNPGIDRINEVIAYWRAIELPVELQYLVHGKPRDINCMAIEKLAMDIRRQIRNLDSSNRLAVSPVILNWLCDLVRLNVKRGRIFDLSEVLSSGSADCLGYAKLLTILTRMFGLKSGVVEVLIDNAGRYVPHTINLVNLLIHAPDKSKLTFWSL